MVLPYASCRRSVVLHQKLLVRSSRIISSVMVAAVAGVRENACGFIQVTGGGICACFPASWSARLLRRQSDISRNRRIILDIDGCIAGSAVTCQSGTTHISCSRLLAFNLIVHPVFIVVHDSPTHIRPVFTQTVQEIIAGKYSSLSIPAHGILQLSVAHQVKAQRRSS